MVPSASLFRKLALLFRRGQFREELKEEMAFHREQMERELRDQGMVSEEAHYAATRRFGDSSRMQERSHEAIGFSLETVAQDVRFALRQIKRNPGFAVAAIAVLALGIGAASAMFTVVYGMLLRPLPFPDESRLFKPIGIDAAGSEDDSFPIESIERWQSVTSGSAEIAVMLTPIGVLDTPSGPQLINAVTGTTNLLSTLDVRPILGRDFRPDEADDGRSHVVVLSYSIWHDAFHGDAQILGRNVQIDGEPFHVIGVMPRGFLFPVYKDKAQVWTPLENSRLHAAKANNPYNTFDCILRIRKGVSPLTVQAALSSVQSQLAKMAGAGQSTPTHVRLSPIRQSIIGDARPALKALEIAVALLWFLACSNVAGLLLARIAARRAEIAIRGALGAGSLRIARQFVTESLLLSLAGAVVGVSLALSMLRDAERIIERSLPLDVSFALNGPLLGSLLGLSVLTALAFSAMPAILATRGTMTEALKSQGQAGGSHRGHARVRNLLVVCEVATSLALLVAAGLMLRTIYSLKHAPLGFRTDHIIVADLTLPGYFYKDKNVTTTAWHPLLERVRHLPGVQAAALSTVLPIGHTTEWLTLVYKTDWTKGNVAAEVRAATPDLMQVLGVHLKQGRFLTGQDVDGSLPVAVVNETFVHQFLGGRDGLGKQFRFGRVPATATIVGVVEDVRQDSVSKPSKAEFYLSMAQIKPGDALYSPMIGRSMQLAVRTQQRPDAMVDEVGRAIHGENPQLIADHMTTMDQSVEDSIGTQRLVGGLILTFGGLALLITVVGLYGLLTYTVTQRTREIGIRMALGADRLQVTGMILRQSLVLMVAGIAIGLAGSFWASQLLTNFLYGVSSRDPWMLVAGPAVLLLSGTVAALIPARSAASIDPMRALRNDT